MQYLYAIVGLALALRGFNDVGIYYFLIGLVLCLKILETSSCFRSLSLGVFLALFPHYTVLYGFLAFLFWDKEDYRVSSVMLTFSLLEWLGYVPYTYGMVVVLYLIIYILFTATKDRVPHVYVGLGVVAIGTILYSILSWGNPISIEKLSYRNPFAPGVVLSKNTGVRIHGYPAHSSLALLRSSSFATRIPEDVPGVVSFDIDYNGDDNRVLKDEWGQVSPWNRNMFLGNQYWLEAIRKDGALYSNKGIRLKDSSRVVLAYPHGLNHSDPLVVQNKNTLLLHDTDYTSDFIANYQIALTQELLHSSRRPIWVRLLNCLFIVFSLLEGWVFTKGLAAGRVFPYFVGLLILAVSIWEYCPRDGDVRIVGRIVNSHENDKADGVLKRLVEQGFDFTVGDKNCRILIVKSGQWAMWRGERIVVAEPNAMIWCDGNCYKVEELPLGSRLGVLDARSWSINGSNTGQAQLMHDNVLFIGTGSPALLQWENILR